MERRRRIDRILADDYLDGLEQRSTAELRRMRDECEEEEAGISYARRILQGKLDILRAELARRRDAGSDQAAAVLERLPEVLGDAGERTPLTRARPPRFLVPPAVRYHRREVERIADEVVLATMGGRDDAELAALAEELAAKEQELSRIRRVLLDRLDRLQAEIAQRYRAGAADVSELLTPPPS